MRHHLALQAQDLRAAQLALRARVRGLAPQDVDAALDERDFVVAWVNRGTLHFVCPEDVHWLRRADRARRRPPLSNGGCSSTASSREGAERAIKTIGPRAGGRRAAGPAPSSSSAPASRVSRSSISRSPPATTVSPDRGPLVGRQHAYVRTEDWIGRRRSASTATRRSPSSHAATRRFGPATEADLAYWSGLPKRDARAGLESIARELVQHGDGLVDLKKRRTAPTRAPAKLLPLWGNYLLGWKDRAFQIDPRHTLNIYANGMIGPAASRGGMLVGRWTAPNGRVQIEPFDGPAPASPPRRNPWSGSSHAGRVSPCGASSLWSLQPPRFCGPRPRWPSRTWSSTSRWPGWRPTASSRPARRQHLGGARHDAVGRVTAGRHRQHLQAGRLRQARRPRAASRRRTVRLGQPGAERRPVDPEDHARQPAAGRELPGHRTSTRGGNRDGARIRTGTSGSAWRASS